MAEKKNTNYNDDDYIHYLYKITNNLNGKYYIGIHSLRKDSGKEPTNDGYWGSGTEIRKAIKEEGRNNFTKEILKTFSTRQELSDEEKRVVNIDEVRNPNCYNCIVGGEDELQSNFGWVICRLKNTIDKIVKISREEYYNNKDLYIPTGHLNYYVNGPKLNTNSNYHYECRQKLDENDKLFSRRKDFVNKNTLEIKTYIGHDEPEDLYNTWFPIYFYDKINNKFISKDYFAELYKNTTNLENLSRKIKISRHNLKIIRDYYNLDKKKENNKGFTGKTYVNKDGNYLVVNNSELDKYISLGYELGKRSKIIDKSVLLPFYIEGKNIKTLSKKFKIKPDRVKSELGLTNTDKSEWFHKNSIKKSIHPTINNELKQKFIENGWIPGKKNY